MRILIVAATANELMGLDRQNQSGEELHTETLVTGVGLLSTTLNLTRRLMQGKPDLVIQTGIAGTFHETLPMGEAVVVVRETQGDLGVVESGGFRSVFDMGLSDPDLLPLSGGWLENPHTEWISKSGLSHANGISVNEVTTDPERMAYYREKLQAHTESMEGAALHQVCLELGVPFIQIRGISNRIGERNKAHWKIKEALAAANLAVNSIINTITN